MKWVFDMQPASGVQTGGGVADHLFSRSIDSFVRETTQNSNDQRRSKDKPVHVKFALHSLTDKFAAAFLSSIGWPDLAQHLEGAAATQSLSRRRIKSALQRAADPTRGFNVLVLSDRNTFGLYGDERASEPNFSNLVRHVLMTSDGHASRGGTYGLGKSVLWAFSDISTVLFHSLPTLKPDANGHAVTDTVGSRFIGRASLVSHKVGNSDFDPNGLLGQVVVDGQQREWSKSIRGAASDLVLPDWLLSPRTNPDDTGTSVIIPFFGAPGRSEPEVSTDDTCQAIAEALNVWYWPAIQSGDLVAEVEHVDNGSQTWSAVADGVRGVENFVSAWSTAQDKLVTIAKDDAQVAERYVVIDVPKTSSQVPSSLQHDRCSAPARLRVIKTDGVETARSGTVALIRGAGMVVKYEKPPGLSVDVPAFVGVLEAGMRHPEPTPQHENVERFLKASEPYAHNDWVPNTDRIAQDYLQGAGASLRRLREGIANAVREALKPDAGDNEDGPTNLSKRFDLAGDKPTVSGRFTIKNVGYDKRTQTWSLDATMTIESARNSVPWKFSGTVEVENKFGKNEPLEIVSTTVISPNLAVAGSPSRTTFECTVPSDARQASIHLIVNADSSIVPAIMRERIALSVPAQVERG